MYYGFLYWCVCVRVQGVQYVESTIVKVGEAKNEKERK